VIAVANAALTMAAAHGWAVSACVTVAGTGLGLSSVASTTLGTAVADTFRGTASGIINTAAQLGTATGIAVVLLIAAATTGLPGPGTSAPVIGWAAAAAIAAAGALAFTRSPRPESATTRGAGPEAGPGLGSDLPSGNPPHATAAKPLAVTMMRAHAPRPDVTHADHRMCPARRPAHCRLPSPVST
jgi:MFS family permease